MEAPESRSERCAALADARIMLLFTPELTGSRDPLEVLSSVLDLVEVVQVRIKSPDEVGSAREHLDWGRAVLKCVHEFPGSSPLVLINDRVDVARTLLDEGCAGAHIGQDDCPPALARETLGPEALIGLSTHDMSQVARALDEPVDYLGFGPVYPTATKGYEEGVGAERCWVASSSASVPVFPIGGIQPRNASELANIGRAAVSSAVLAAEDPRAAVEALRSALES